MARYAYAHVRNMEPDPPHSLSQDTSPLHRLSQHLRERFLVAAYATLWMVRQRFRFDWIIACTYSNGSCAVANSIVILARYADNCGLSTSPWSHSGMMVAGWCAQVVRGSHRTCIYITNIRRVGMRNKTGSSSLHTYGHSVYTHPVIRTVDQQSRTLIARMGWSCRRNRRNADGGAMEGPIALSDYTLDAVRSVTGKPELSRRPRYRTFSYVEVYMY